MATRNKRLQELAAEYTELTAALTTVQTDLAALKAELLRGLQKGEGVEVDANTVLTVAERVPDRKAITQKLMHEAKVPQACIDALLKATKPHAGSRTRTLKLVLLSEFTASVARADARATAEEEAKEDE